MRIFTVLALTLVFAGCWSQPAPPQSKPAPDAAPAPKVKAEQPKIEPAQKVVEEPGQPAPAQPKRPFMLPDLKAIKEWDFTQLAQDKWDWRFPAEAKSTPEGALYTTGKSGPGPQIHNAAIPANEVTHVIVAVTASPAGDTGEAAMTGLAFFYNGSGQALAQDTPPTDEKYSARFQPLPGRPGTYIAKLTGAPNWQGAVNECALDVTLPQVAGVTDFDVRVARIQFITTKGAKPFLLKPPPPKPSADAAPNPVPEPSGATIKAWDFASLAQDKWEWMFPGGQAKSTPEGALFTADKSGTGLVMQGAAIPAGKVTHVRLGISMKLLENGAATEPVTFRSLKLSFNGTGPDAPCVAFAPVVGRPDQYVATLIGVKEWHGEIKDCALQLDIPDLAPDQIEAKTTYAICVNSIQFIDAKTGE